MNFALRYWTQLRHQQAAQTQINTAVSQALAEEGIEVSRPQRELYLKEAGRNENSDANDTLTGILDGSKSA